MSYAERNLDCLIEDAAGSLPVHAVRPEGLAGFLAGLPAEQAAFLRGAGFAAKAGKVALLPGSDGVAAAVLGLGSDPEPALWGALPVALPAGSRWHLAPAIASDPLTLEAAVLGWCMGAYRFDGLRSSPKPVPALLALAAGEAAAARRTARAMWLARDLINLPANRLGPSDLAAAAASALQARGASPRIVAGDALTAEYPAIAVVGRGSVREPRVLVLHWQGSQAGSDAPLVSICGKGVCFDTGGYDLKPSAGMLRMKKDMGGAAIALGLACMVIEADLPVRLALRLGCVENAVSGDAMRPLDVISTRRGLSVEVGNTDAEGRLVLCDLLAEASDEAPALLMDFATLTGAARVALGPDLPAMFSNDDDVAATVMAAASQVHDYVYRLPLWQSYNSWLDSNVADLNNVSTKPLAGAIIAGLFLQRFVPATCRWLHFDVYAWNDTSRPGKPEGGEVPAMQAAFAAISIMFAVTERTADML